MSSGVAAAAGVALGVVLTRSGYVDAALAGGADAARTHGLTALADALVQRTPLSSTTTPLSSAPAPPPAPATAQAAAPGEGPSTLVLSNRRKLVVFAAAAAAALVARYGFKTVKLALRQAADAAQAALKGTNAGAALSGSAAAAMAALDAVLASPPAKAAAKELQGVRDAVHARCVQRCNPAGQGPSAAISARARRQLGGSGGRPRGQGVPGLGAPPFLTCDLTRTRSPLPARAARCSSPLARPSRPRRRCSRRWPGWRRSCRRDGRCWRRR